MSEIPDGQGQKRNEGRRYVLLGSHREADVWRRERNLSWRDVVYVSTRSGSALRGLCGSFEVITFPSWAQASARVRAEVEQNLAIAALTRGRQPEGTD